MTYVERYGIKWHVAENVMNLPLFGHEDQLVKWAAGRFPKGKQFLDVGANVGVFSIGLAKNFEEIIAVEPHPVNIHILKKNIELNELKNVRVLEVAAGRYMDIFHFESTYNSLASSVFKANIDANKMATTFPVLAVPLDDYDLSPDFIKMDIEGGEYEAIYGLAETMKRSNPIMLIEIHQFKDGRTVGKFQDIMKNFGYKCVDVLAMGDSGILQNFNYVYEHV